MRISDLKTLQLSAYPLAVILSHASLDDFPTYSALSYTWGVDDASHPLQTSRVESVEEEVRVILIRPNLRQALRVLRHPTQARVLWIDALCINQGSVTERNKQVLLMKRVYSQAAEVFIWLGGEDEDTETALRLAAYIHSVESSKYKTWIGTERKEQVDLYVLWGILNDDALSLEMSPELAKAWIKEFHALKSGDSGLHAIENQNNVPHRNNTVFAAFKDVLLRPQDELQRPQFKADRNNTEHPDTQKLKKAVLHRYLHRLLGTIVERPWFYRVWILQEVTLAQKATIVVGHFMMAWDALVAAEEYLHLNGLVDESLHRDGGHGSKVQQMNVIRKSVKEKGNAELVRLLTYTHSGRCTDPRDRLYGVLGLVDLAIYGELNVDYSSPVSQVLSRGMFTLYNQYDELTILLLAPLRSSDPGIKGLPSWYPDFTIHQTGNLWLHRPSLRGINAAPGSKKNIQLGDMTSELRIKGCLVDTVKATTVKLQVRDEGGLGHGVYRGYERSEDEEQAARTVLYTWKWFMLYHLGRPSTEYLPTGQTLEEGFNTTVTAGTKFTLDLLADFLRMSVDRLFFVTKKGYMATGPLDTKRGDEIFLFSGCVTPFVARRAEKAGGPPRYELVGATFVNGYMTGEAMPKNDEGWCDIILV